MFEFLEPYGYEFVFSPHLGWGPLFWPSLNYNIKIFYGRIFLMNRWNHVTICCTFHWCEFLHQTVTTLSGYTVLFNQIRSSVSDPSFKFWTRLHRKPYVASPRFSLSQTTIFLFHSSPSSDSHFDNPSTHTLSKEPKIFIFEINPESASESSSSC